MRSMASFIVSVATVSAHQGRCRRVGCSAGRAASFWVGLGVVPTPWMGLRRAGLPLSCSFGVAVTEWRLKEVS